MHQSQRVSFILLPLLLLAVACARLANAAHLPAVRRVTSAGTTSRIREEDSKRVLASRLIRSADKHKERSLRDVLGESDRSFQSASRSGNRDEERRKARAERAARDRVFESGGSIRKARESEAKTSTEDESAEKEQVEDERHGIRTMSELFQWAINNTVRGSSYGGLFTIGERDDTPAADSDGSVRERAVEVDLPQDDKVIRENEKLSAVRQQGKFSGRRALPPGTARATRDSVRNARGRGATGGVNGGAKSINVDDDLELLTSASESEYDIMRRNVHVLDNEGMSANKKVRALLMLEELCHSIDNGRDLQISGGISPLLRALNSRHDKVRASAAWALATCCQNNPPVQNASLELNAVPKLSKLAAHDVNANVRSRALFALNAMLELESARIAFEELPHAIDAVRNALVDSSDFRATRRALNLAELLVQKNLDAWKTQLEAWDVPILIERLMRTHPDIDVRESAARTIAALDGRPVA